MTSFRLFIEQECLYIGKTQSNMSEVFLKIEFKTKNMSICSQESYEPEVHTKQLEIFCVVGLFELAKCKCFNLFKQPDSYLLVCYQASCAGSIKQKEIFKIVKVAAIPLHYANACTVVDSIKPYGGNESSTFYFGSLLENYYVQNFIHPGVEKDKGFPEVDSEKQIIEQAQTKNTDVDVEQDGQSVSGSMAMAELGKKMQSLGAKFFISLQTSLTSNKNETKNIANVKECTIKDPDQKADKPVSEDNIADRNDPNQDKLLKTMQRKRAGTTGSQLDERFTPSPSKSDIFTASYFDSTQDKKTLVEIISLFNSGLFYFSSTYNLTRTCQYLNSKEENNDDYWDDLDERFFWNKNLLKRFLDSKLYGFVVPVIQGFVQVQKGSLEKLCFDFALISRRSKYRCGLRYQRRGIDENGDVANFVETEHILSFEQSEKESHILSFVQIRGSIPLFWSQSAASRKPVPVVSTDAENNNKALRLHFLKLKEFYNDVCVVSLTECTGREYIVGKPYQQTMKLMHPEIQFHDFDIHKVCKGMKFENIQNLVDSLEPFLREIGFFWKRGDVVFSRQTGVIRTNCMDCLDRTNVVQAFISRCVLNSQLLRNGVHSYPEKGLSYYVDFEILFNNLWANNGDAVSICYTNTSALKGDVTRTGKRNIQGMVNDGTSAVLRMYHNNFKDSYRQQIIDYLLGVTALDSLKVKETTDEKSDTYEEVAKEHNEAINVAVSMILLEEENLNIACIVSAVEVSMIRVNGLVLTEKVFLLTKDSYYLVFYDYFLEKVSHYKKISLRNVKKIQKGTLFLESNMLKDYENNCGLMITYEGEEEEIRTSSTVFNHAELIKLFQRKPQEPQSNIKTDIFKINSNIDSSRSIAEQVSAMILNNVLALEFSGNKAVPKDFVMDADITPFITSKHNLIQKFIRNLSTIKK